MNHTPRITAWRAAALVAALVIVALAAAGVPAPARAQEGECSGPPMVYFRCSERVQLSNAYGDRTFALKAFPDPTSETIETLHPDDIVTIRDVRPTCGGGYYWWPVSTEDFVIGWLAAAQDMDNDASTPPGPGQPPATDPDDDDDAQPPGPDQPEEPAAPAEPDQSWPETGPAIFSDDFSDTGSGWTPGSGDNHAVSYQNGQWRMAILNSWTSMWSRPRTGETPLDNLSDFSAEVDVTPINRTGAAGFAFRLDTGGDNYYQFVIRPASGEYRLRVRDGGSWRTLVDWTASSAIRRHPATNRLGVTAVGDTITLYINGQQVRAIQDNTLSRGWLGFALWQPNGNDNVSFAFDNLLVTEPRDIAASAPAAAPPASYACPGTPPLRLSVGAQGRVTSSASNNFRAAPGLGGALLGAIPGGASFQVVGGPRCVDGYTWWQVTYQGTTGWTASGQDNTYWLEP